MIATTRATTKKKRRPIYFKVSKVADILGWSKKQTMGWLRRENALVKRAGYWVTTKQALRESFPEAYDELSGIEPED